MITVFLTVLSSVLTLVLGQLAIKLFVEPVHEFKRTVADIALALIEYAKVYGNPGVLEDETEKKTSEDLRLLSARLMAQMGLIPCYPRTRWVFRLPLQEKVVSAAGKLLALSNSTRMDGESQRNTKVALEIRESLGIFMTEDDKNSLKMLIGVASQDNS